MPAFKCGHTADEPRNMGRGSARQERIRVYFNRNCCDCRVANELEHIATLTAPKFTQSEIDQRVAKIRAQFDKH